MLLSLSDLFYFVTTGGVVGVGDLDLQWYGQCCGVLLYKFIYLVGVVLLLGLWLCFKGVSKEVYEFCLVLLLEDFSLCWWFPLPLLWLESKGWNSGPLLLD
jgi:hypothetical protein